MIRRLRGVFDYKMAVKAAIEKNELNKLVRGLDGYFYEDHFTKGPVDYISILDNLYNAYDKHNNIDKQLESELLFMLDEEYDNFVMALNYIVFHLSFVEDGANSFDLNVNNIVEKASERARLLWETISEEQKNSLIMINKNLKSYGYKIYI